MINRVTIYHDTSIVHQINIKYRELSVAAIVYVSYMLLREHKVGQWRIQEFFSVEGWGSTNSVEDGGQRKRGSGGR